MRQHICGHTQRKHQFGSSEGSETLSKDPSWILTGMSINLTPSTDSSFYGDPLQVSVPPTAIIQIPLLSLLRSAWLGAPRNRHMTQQNNVSPLPPPHLSHSSPPTSPCSGGLSCPSGKNNARLFWLHGHRSDVAWALHLLLSAAPPCQEIQTNRPTELAKPVHLRSCRFLQQQLHRDPSQTLSFDMKFVFTWFTGNLQTVW